MAAEAPRRRHTNLPALRPVIPLRELAPRLEQLYQEYTRREFVSPDPLAAVYHFKHWKDQEIAGLLAAAFAFGNVKQILKTLDEIFHHLPNPRRDLEMLNRQQLEQRFSHFQYRYIRPPQLIALLTGVQALLKQHESLGAAFESGLLPQDTTVAPALTRWIASIDAAAGIPMNYLLPCPARGSACKRLFLYLRWMIRSDNVDLGIWPISPRLLVIPLDTHMHKMSLALRLTRRKQATLATALEVTAQFRKLAPEDPVRYDFALTRLGIRREMSPAEYIRTLHPSEKGRVR